MRTTMLAVLTILTATGCAVDGERFPDRTIVTDSAGTTIMRYAQDLDELPSLGLTSSPSVQISSEDYRGPPLYNVTDVLPLPNGAVAVASEGSHTVLVFGLSGDLVATLGGEGTGPGEFQGLGNIVRLPPDSLAVFDYRLRRVTVFGPRGSVGRTFDVSDFVPSGAFFELHAVPDGFVLVGQAGLEALGTEQTARGEAYSYRLGLTGDSVGALGPFPGAEVFRTDRLMGNLPFGARLFSAIRGDRLIIGTSDVPEMRELREDGSIARIVRWSDHGREVTEDRNARYVDRLLQPTPEVDRQQMREILLSVPHSSSEPSYHDLVVSTSGMIWVGDYPGPEAFIPETPSPERSWLVFDIDEGVVSSATTPRGFQLMAVHNGQALGAHRDSLGAETIRVYGIEPR